MIDGDAFARVPRNARGHFVLAVYQAVWELIRYLDASRGAPDADRDPFLSSYRDELEAMFPADVPVADRSEWFAAALERWERGCDTHLPLGALTSQLALRPAARVAWILIGLVEEDSRFGTLFADLQQAADARRPSVDRLSRIVCAGDPFADPWETCRPLIAAGLAVPVDRDVPRSDWVLRIPAPLWDLARGATVSAAADAPWTYHGREQFVPIADQLIDPGFRARLAELPAMLESGRLRACVLRGHPGDERFELAGAMAASVGCDVLQLEMTASSADRVKPYMGAACALVGAIPVFAIELAPGETCPVPPLNGYAGPIVVITGVDGGLTGDAVERGITLTVPTADRALRLRQWEHALAGLHVSDLPGIADRVRLPPEYLRRAASAAQAYAHLEHRDTIDSRDVANACRELNRQLLDTLATRLEPAGTWTSVVTSDLTAAKLRDVERRCRHRERLFDRVGPAFVGSRNRGVRALFSGASGTGKTLAARVLGAELGHDVYRADLSAILDRYVGETEKNLHRLLTRAEALDVVLLLDEGDGLLGARTEVRSANDRYANLETNFLLQRLESYQGIVIVTSNASENIDSAFHRRMDVVVEFVAPGPEERWQIWQLHLPPDHRLDDAAIEELAVRCAMTGGQIRNAALNATLLALDQATQVSRPHVEIAVRNEYRKAGAACPLPGDRAPRDERDAVEDFLDALAP